jgi:hypothetical protein
MSSSALRTAAVETADATLLDDLLEELRERRQRLAHARQVEQKLGLDFGQHSPAPTTITSASIGAGATRRAPTVPARGGARATGRAGRAAPVLAALPRRASVELSCLSLDNSSLPRGTPRVPRGDGVATIGGVVTGRVAHPLEAGEELRIDGARSACSTSTACRWPASRSTRPKDRPAWWGAPRQMAGSFHGRHAE